MRLAWQSSSRFFCALKPPTDRQKLSPFRINTCKSVSKQRTLTSFRINTYEKQGEGASPPGVQTGHIRDVAPSLLGRRAVSPYASSRACSRTVKKRARNLSPVVASNPVAEYDSGLLSVPLCLAYPAERRFGPTNLKAGYRAVEQLLPLVI